MNIFNAIPLSLQRLADEVPQLHVRTSVDREAARCGAIDLHSMAQDDNEKHLAYKLAPYLTHRWVSDFTNHSEVLTSSITKPLSEQELISILSRAYELGRASG